MTTIIRERNTVQVPALDNEEIADRFDEIATLLEEQEANPFRIQAYRNAAQTLREFDQPVDDLLRHEGLAGLRALPGIGASLARAIEQLVRTGRMDLLDRLRGNTAPEQLLATVPGIGPVLAHRIHEQLGITTLTDLEAAAYDGRLDRVPGLGTGRIRAIRESLAGRFRRHPRIPERAGRQSPGDDPPVAELLDIDREYRTRAAADDLPRIAPRRFNPTHEAWLPILHTERADRHYTALYSNTARAHALNKTQDWVVIYQDDPDNQRQWTVVTAQQGPLNGKRVVRGREAACQTHYARRHQTT